VEGFRSRTIKRDLSAQPNVKLNHLAIQEYKLRGPNTSKEAKGAESSNTG